MRMRTIAAAHAELMAADPGCELTKTALRRLVVTGQLHGCVVRVGQKYLINMDALEDYLQGITPLPVTVPGIREIKL